MAQWGNTDDAANSVSWAIEGLIANNGDPAATQTTLFGNTTPVQGSESNQPRLAKLNSW